MPCALRGSGSQTRPHPITSRSVRQGWSANSLEHAETADPAKDGAAHGGVDHDGFGDVQARLTVSGATTASGEPGEDARDDPAPEPDGEALVRAAHGLDDAVEEGRPVRNPPAITGADGGRVLDPG